MQARYTGSSPAWLGVGFSAIPGQMVGATAVIGSNEGVAMYQLGAQFPSAVTQLAYSWQTLLHTSFETANGVSVLSFQKRLDENQFERPSDQAIIRPDEPTHMIWAVGSSTELSWHAGR